MLTDYTTYADVRAALGVSEEELSDATLGLDLYSTKLNLSLSDIGSTLISTYTTIKDKAEKTAEEQVFYDAVRLFSAYSVAKQCCISLPMFGPKEVSDSKAAVVRFSDSPYKETAKAVYREYESLKLRVTDMFRAIATASGSRVNRVFIRASRSTYDPITG